MIETRGILTEEERALIREESGWENCDRCDSPFACASNCSCARPSAPERCTCMTAVNDHLKPHNTRLSTSFTFTRDMSGMDVLPMIVVEKIDTKQRKRPMNVIPTFCPFCGTKYPRKGEEGAGLPETMLTSPAERT